MLDKSALYWSPAVPLPGPRRGEGGGEGQGGPLWSPAVPLPGPRRGEGGREGQGGPLWSPAVLLILSREIHEIDTPL